ncbi:MAG: VWA domain-containing protein [Chloroflexota bacterium]
MDLAKLAALALLDLSQLDATVSGRDSVVALVTFLDNAWLVQPLTQDYVLLEEQIEILEPLNQTNIGHALILALDELEAHADLEKPLLVILLSDGETNRGLTKQEILDIIPQRAKELMTTICTVGFGNSEEEIDKELLEELAKETEGEYLFATRGEELGGFFIACRQKVVSDLIEQITGVARLGERGEVKHVTVPENTCELTLAVNYLKGDVIVEMADPQGVMVDSTYTGFNLQRGENVQLITLMNPLTGDWLVSVKNNDPTQENVYFSIVVSSEKCKTPLPTATTAPTATPTPPPSLLLTILEKVSPLTIALICMVGLVGGAIVFFVLIQKRGKEPGSTS